MGVDNRNDVGPLPICLQVHQYLRGRLQIAAGRFIRRGLPALQVGYDQLLRGEEAFAEAAGSGQDAVLAQAHRDIAVGGGYISLLVEETTDVNDLLSP
jgi:hypothetical protein